MAVADTLAAGGTVSLLAGAGRHRLVVTEQVKNLYCQELALSLPSRTQMAGMRWLQEAPFRCH